MIHHSKLESNHVFAYGPKTGPAFLRFLALWYVGGWEGVITFCVFVVFDLLRWTHFMSRWTRYTISLDTSTVLRWARLLYFGVHTSCYVGHVYGTSVYTLHGTLDTSTVLRWAHFMLRWACLRVVAKRKNHPNVTFFEGVQHAFISSHCIKTEVFGRSQ